MNIIQSPTISPIINTKKGNETIKKKEWRKVIHCGNPLREQGANFPSTQPDFIFFTWVSAHHLQDLETAHQPYSTPKILAASIKH